MPASWLRAAWALAAFVPLAILATPIFAYQIGTVFLLCAMYLWPASWVAQQIGITPLTPPYAVVAAVYCAGLGWTVASIVSRVLRLPAHVERRRAIVLVTVVWLPIFAFAGFRFLDYKGVASNATQCPGHMYALQPHCKDISDFREHELAGFIDRTFVATLRLRPGALPDIVAANQMKEISPADVPVGFWSQPPFWWTIRLQAAARIYVTPAFSFEGRGRDGDHYLFIEERLTNDVFVYLQNNF